MRGNEFVNFFSQSKRKPISPSSKFHQKNKSYIDSLWMYYVQHYFPSELQLLWYIVYTSVAFTKISWIHTRKMITIPSLISEKILLSWSADKVNYLIPNEQKNTKIVWYIEFHARTHIDDDKCCSRWLILPPKKQQIYSSNSSVLLAYL